MAVSVIGLSVNVTLYSKRNGFLLMSMIRAFSCSLNFRFPLVSPRASIMKSFLSSGGFVGPHEGQVDAAAGVDPVAVAVPFVGGQPDFPSRELFTCSLCWAGQTPV